MLPSAAVPFLLVATIVLFGILSPELFLSLANFRITLAAQATVVLLAIGITIPLRAGEIDLSMPAVMILSGTLVGVLYAQGVPLMISLLVALVAGVAVGLINSLFIVVVGLESLIVTLGMFTLLAGINLLLSSGNLITTIPAELSEFANIRFLSLALPVWIGWALAAVVWFVFEFTPLGRYLLFLGGNPSAAKLAGLRTGRLKCGALVSASTISALAGILLAGTLASVDPSSAASYLLAPVTAAFLGTTTIQMGRFNVVGTLIAIYLIAFGVTGLQLLGSAGWVSDVFNGAALILALSFARYFELFGVNRPGGTDRR